MRNIIFDLDGTLVDSVPGIQWSVEAALKNCGSFAVCPDLTPLIGPPIRAILATAANSSDSLELDRLEQSFRTVYDSEGWRRTLCQPGVRAMLNQLQAAGGILCIVTNKPAHATRLILGELALTGYFREMISRDSVTPPFASKGAMLADLIDRRGWHRDETILIGDTLEDCRAAVAARIACAIVPHGYGKEWDSVLPQGCRLISGWGELIAFCTGTVLAKDIPRQSALMTKGDN